jgi:hypothetical protein
MEKLHTGPWTLQSGQFSPALQWPAIWMAAPSGLRGSSQ